MFLLLIVHLLKKKNPIKYLKSDIYDYVNILKTPSSSFFFIIFIFIFLRIKIEHSF